MSTLLKKILWRIDVLAPLRMRPIARAPGYTQSHQAKGTAYHDRFARLRGRRMVWGFEQEFLLEFAGREGPFDLHLDFAGGTGRIAGVLERHSASQVVLDVSDTMLEVARSHLKQARIVCADFRRAEGIVQDGSVQVATAFRFFPNAEATLREDAMRFIARVLRPGGLLVCNNHRNFWSVPYVARRLVFSRLASGGMTTDDMVRLAGRHGLSLVETRAIGVVPQSERLTILPWSAVERIERAVWQRWGSRQRAGYNVIFVFAKG